ncbi:MAG: sigma-54 dependent transcriptional regulator [Pseudomonadota bacterium]
MRDLPPDRQTGVLIGESAAMDALRERIAAVAPSPAPVLITGPTGAGKERVAEAVHMGSQRPGPCVSINCGALPPELLEAELFGHEKGAFTGAIARRTGLIEEADGGTLFLDEVGEMPPALQVRLLRVLETKRYSRVGGRAALTSDFRLLAATHRDLRAEVAAGRFREDLLFRMDVLRIHVPPLAERRSDIPALLGHLAELAGVPALEVDPAGEAVLFQHPWRGNVRELRNFHDRAQAFYGGRTLGAVEVADTLGTPTGTALAPGTDPVGKTDLKRILLETETALISQAVAQCDGNVAEAARRLGLKRTTLLSRMRRLSLRS